MFLFLLVIHQRMSTTVSSSESIVSTPTQVFAQEFKLPSVYSSNVPNKPRNGKKNKSARQSLKDNVQKTTDTNVKLDKDHVLDVNAMAMKFLDSILGSSVQSQGGCFQEDCEDRQNRDDIEQQLKTLLKKAKTAKKLAKKLKKAEKKLKKVEKDSKKASKKAKKASKKTKKASDKASKKTKKDSKKTALKSLKVASSKPSKKVLKKEKASKMSKKDSSKKSKRSKTAKKDSTKKLKSKK
jgi:hypothetical protein